MHGNIRFSISCSRKFLSRLRYHRMIHWKRCLCGSLREHLAKRLHQWWSSNRCSLSGCETLCDVANSPKFNAFNQTMMMTLLTCCDDSVGWKKWITGWRHRNYKLQCGLVIRLSEIVKSLNFITHYDYRCRLLITTSVNTAINGGSMWNRDFENFTLQLRLFKSLATE